MELVAAFIVAFVYGGFASGLTFSSKAAFSGTLAGIATFVVLFFLQVALAPRGLDRVRQKEIDDLTEKLVLGQQKIAEYLPVLKIEINEVLVRAVGPTGAVCFLHLTLHNLTEKAPCVLVNWSLGLRLENTTKSATVLLGMKDRQLAHYTEVTNFNEIPPNTPYYVGENGLPAVEFGREEIVDIRALITEDHPLRRGFPQSGWLGFMMGGVPTWPSYVVDSVIEDEVRQVIYKTNTVREASLEIVDGHGERHSGKKIPPFSVDWEDRQILWRQSSSDSVSALGR